eukprot:3356407-Pyramimonas_sp.AAC.1
MGECVPSSLSSTWPSHPWFTEECSQLVQEKILAAGTPSFPEACRRCSNGLLRAHNCFIQRARGASVDPSGQQTLVEVVKQDFK